MATAESLKDEHLSCSICYMPFTEPKTLQCLHSFCQDCLQNHINHGTHLWGIPCPVCRHVTVIEDSFKPRQKWAELLKTDFKLAGILEALHQMEKGAAPQTDAIVVTSSSVPGNDRKTQLNTMLQVLQPAISFIQGKIEEERACLETMEQTRTSTEDDIRSFFGQLIDAIKVKQMKLLDDLAATHEIGKKESEENIQRYTSLTDETKDTIGLIGRLLSPGSEYATMECLPRIQKQQEAVMRFVTDPPTATSPLHFSFQENVKTTKSLLKSLDLGSISAKSGNDDLPAVTAQIFWKKALESHKGETGTSKLNCEEATCSNEPNSGSERHPYPSAQATTPAPTQTSAPGPVQVQVQAQSPTVIQPVVTHNPTAGAILNVHPSLSYVLQKTVETKLDEDNYAPSLKNIVILQGKTSLVIIVLDYDNASLKAFYEVDGQIQRYLHRFSGYPQSIAKFANDKVIVSLMSYKFVIFTADLKQINSIESEKWYSSMATITSNEKLFGFVNTTTTTIMGGRMNVLEHLTAKGKPVNKLPNVPATEDLFSDISDMCVTPTGNVVISDNVNREIICITPDGSVVWRVSSGEQELLLPSGVATDSSGDVFAVDKERSRVVKIDGADGRVIGDVLTRENGLQSPLALALDIDNNMYITQDSGIVSIYSL